MPYTHYRVRALIRDIRSRWRRRAVLQGTAISVGVLAVWGSLLLLLETFSIASPAVLIVGAVVGGLLLAGVVVQYVIRPALRKITDQQIALYVEEQVPELEDRLNSVVEIDDPEEARRAHGILVDRLIDDAADRARTIPLTTIVDRHRERLLTAASAVCLVLFAVFGYSSLDNLKVAFSSVDVAAIVPSVKPLMRIHPGDVEIEQGASQEIVVTLREESDRDVVLHFRSGDASWQKETMQPGIGEPAFLYEFLNVQEPVEYFVEHDQNRSEPFTISLYTFPAVEQIDLTYVYPEYAGQSSRREENTGDILGLKGSTVTIDVSTSGSVGQAEMVLDDGRSVSMSPAGEGRFRGRIQLEEQGFYSVRLIDDQKKQNKFPDEYQIVPIEDEPPLITITDPERDVRANSVQEVLVAASAQDDYGIRDLRLRFAVNGGEEQTIPLKDNPETRPVDVTGEHLFFLEDYTLEPGDVISYYVEAEDLYHEDPEVTDMYFIEVIPFDQEYSQVTAGGSMGGGAQSGLVLNQQQIIAATWKLLRERSEMSDEDHEASRRALAQAQQNLRRNIEQRISATAFSLELRQSEENRKIAELLRSAVKSMGEAVVELEGDRLREALSPEREALNHLLKADALNKEQQIALNRGQQQGAGSASATEERMTELMDLELDISKDKYEVLPQSSASSGQNDLDETLQKLRELSRRQQNLANDSRRALEGEDQRRQVERLKRDQDDLRRQAQSLAQSMRQLSREDDRLGESVESRLNRATERMQEAEQALNEGDVQQARARQQQAVNDLERLTRDLRMASNDDAREALEEMNRGYDQMRDQEQQLARDLERAAEQSAAQGGRVSTEEMERLAEKRRAIREGLEDLDAQAESIAGRKNDPDLATAARNLRQRIRREGLDEQMRESEQALEQGWLDFARRREEGIEGSMERLDEAMRAFDDHLPATDEQRLARALEEVRELKRELREMQAQSGEQSGRPVQQEGQPSPQGQQSAQGQESSQQADQASAQGGDGSDRAERADAARRQAQMRRARERLERLQEDLQGTTGADAFNNLHGALRRADNWNDPIGTEQAKAFFNEEVFSPLSQLEEALVRELDQIALERKLYGSRPGDVPAEYRELVEKYYESLSRSAGR